MKPRLDDELIAQIRSSTEPVVELARRLSIGTSSISKYRPTRRKHLTEAEQDQVITEWLARIPTSETAVRLGVTKQTIQTARRRAMTDLIRGSSNGAP